MNTNLLASGRGRSLMGMKIATPIRQDRRQSGNPDHSQAIIGPDFESAIEEILIFIRAKPGFGLPITDYLKSEKPLASGGRRQRGWVYEVRFDDGAAVTLIFGLSPGKVRRFMQKFSRRKRRFMSGVVVRFYHTKDLLRTRIANALRAARAALKAVSAVNEPVQVRGSSKDEDGNMRSIDRKRENKRSARFTRQEQILLRY